jgi:hypothetical protein
MKRLWHGQPLRIGLILLVMAASLAGPHGLPATAQAPPDTAPRGPDSANTNPQFFLEVREALMAQLAAKHLDGGKQAFHFVVFYNTAAPVSPGYGKTREVITGLLYNFLVEGDHISMVPFQLQARDDYAFWDRDFNRETAQEIAKLPDRPVTEDSYSGGHDLDAALLKTLKRLDRATLKRCIFIALTDGQQFFDTPLGIVNYPRANANQALQQAGFKKVVEKSVPFPYSDHTDKQFWVTYRIYLPEELEPLAPLSPATDKHAPDTDIGRTLRDHKCYDLWGKPVLPPPNKKKNDTTKPVPKARGDDGGIIAVVGAVVILGGIGGYLTWLLRPRVLSIGVNSVRPATVKYGHPLLLGTEDNEKLNMIQLDSLPDGMSPKEKIARLEVTLTGAVQLSGERWKPDKNPIVIQPNQPNRPRIRMSRGTGNSILLQVTRTR